MRIHNLSTPRLAGANLDFSVLENDNRLFPSTEHELAESI